MSERIMKTLDLKKYLIKSLSLYISIITTWVYVLWINVLYWLLIVFSGKKYPFVLVSSVPCQPPYSDWTIYVTAIEHCMRLSIGILACIKLREIIKNREDVNMKWTFFYSFLFIEIIPFFALALLALFNVNINFFFASIILNRSVSLYLFNNGVIIPFSILLVGMISIFYLFLLYIKNGKSVLISIAMLITYLSSIIVGWVIWHYFLRIVLYNNIFYYFEYNN